MVWGILYYYKLILIPQADLYVIQNPALHLKPEEEISIVRYIVKNWKEKAEIAK
jgi:hypothetical protein